jgi:phenylpropionate dioxygenase-like ring-hydroxylating dioxygenase large terminal subunit
MTTTQPDAAAEAVVSPITVPGSRYPTGWFQVGWSDEVAVGELKLVRYFGRDIVLWRGQSGLLSAADAYCLHLGANLGVGGCVKGDDIVCPWHGWQWDGQGHNTHIPFSSQSCKPHLRLEVWTVQEWYGAILLWHDRAGGGPTWDPPAFDELDGGSFFPITGDMRRSQAVKAHPQMPVENGADATHLVFIHGAGLPPTFDEVAVEGHTWRTKLTAYYGEGKDGSWLTPEGAVKLHLQFALWGIGLGTATWPPELMSGFMITNITPVDETYTEIFWCMTTKKAPGEGDEMSPAGRKFIEHQWRTVTQDFFIWENMKTLHTPNFTPEEAKYYATLRRWAWQFYPDAAKPARGLGAGA